MKKNLKKKENQLDLISNQKTDLYKSIEAVMDNEGLIIRFKDPYNPKYHSKSDQLVGKISIDLDWKDIPKNQKTKILKLFKLSEEIINELKSI